MNYIINTPALLNVKVTSNIREFASEQRFDRGMTVATLKNRLELITGASSGTMKIDVYNDKDQMVFSLDDDSRLFGSYVVEDGYRLHIVDSEKRTGEFDDVSKVQKFELSENEYSQRTDTVKSFLKRNQLGKYNEEEQERIDEQRRLAKEEEEQKASSISVGSRCEVKTSNSGTKRGTVKFVGKTNFKDGLWVGIQYDEPCGKNDGEVEGKKYFEAPMKYGGFVRPASVTVGDFPEMEDDMDEM